MTTKTLAFHFAFRNQQGTLVREVGKLAFPVLKPNIYAIVSPANAWGGSHTTYHVHNGKFYTLDGGKGLPISDLAAILAWEKEPFLGTEGHPLMLRNFQDSEVPYDVVQGFAPPDWGSGIYGGLHGRRAEIYGGSWKVKRDEDVVKRPSAPKGRALSGQGMRISSYGQDIVDRRYAIIDDFLMRCVDEPVIQIRSANGASVSVESASAGNLWQLGGNHSLAVLPLAKLDDAVRMAKQVTQRTGGHVRVPVVVDVVLPKSTQIVSRYFNFGHVASSLVAAAHAVAAILPDVALRALVGMNHAIPKTLEELPNDEMIDRYVEHWKKFQQSIGTLPLTAGKEGKALRTLNLRNEYVRVFLAGSQKAPKQSTEFVEMPLAPHADTVKSAVELLLTAGGPFLEAWFAARTAVARNEGWKQALSDMERAQIVEFPTNAARKRWQSGTGWREWVEREEAAAAPTPTPEEEEDRRRMHLITVRSVLSNQTRYFVEKVLIAGLPVDQVAEVLDEIARELRGAGS